MLSAASIVTIVTYYVADYITKFISVIASGSVSSAEINEQTKANIIEQATSKSKRRDNGWIIYGDLDSNGRATGAVAKITPNMIGSGTRASVPQIILILIISICRLNVNNKIQNVWIFYYKIYQQ